MFPRGALVMGVKPVLKFQSADEWAKGLPVKPVIVKSASKAA